MYDPQLRNLQNFPNFNSNFKSSWDSQRYSLKTSPAVIGLHFHSPTSAPCYQVFYWLQSPDDAGATDSHISLKKIKFTFDVTGSIKLY